MSCRIKFLDPNYQIIEKSFNSDTSLACHHAHCLTKLLHVA